MALQITVTGASDVDPPCAITARTPICLPGFFYWSALQSLTGHGRNMVRSDVILRFSLRDEMFTVQPNPPCRGFLSHNDTLCELHGKLCYVHSDSLFDVAIWLAEDGPSLAWSMRCRVNWLLSSRLRFNQQDKIFLSVDEGYLLSCDLRDGSQGKIICMHTCYTIMETEQTSAPACSLSLFLTICSP
ncbi:hypothetical protein EJB05_57045, partial [Eragrostis curvula]